MILIAAALRKELRTLKRELSRLDQSGSRTTNDALRTTRFLVTGLGTDRTAAALETAFESSTPDVLILGGTAGQLDPGVEMGSVIVPEAWRLEAGTRFEIQQDLLQRVRAAGLTTAPLGLTVHIPVVRAEARRRHFETMGASICDMESTAALMVSAAHEVPCVPIKVVSDTAETGLLGFYRDFDRNMGHLARAVEQLIEAIADARKSEQRRAKSE